MSGPDQVHLLIPVKAFSRAKARLAPALDASQRRTLARALATRVVEAATGLPTWVVCDDPEVARWATSMGVEISWQPGVGLNGALSSAMTEAFSDGATSVAVVHGDLPLVESLSWLAGTAEEVVLAPDRHDDGTNVLAVPTPLFRFDYGPGSFRRHLAEAERLGLCARVIRDPRLGWDVDVPTDLVGLRGILDVPAPTGEPVPGRD